MMQSKAVSEKGHSKSTTLFRWIGRLLIISIILVIVSYFTPGFSIRGMWSFLIAALVISVLDYVVEKFIGVDASPFGKGIKGFFIAALIIYFAQFLVPNMSVTILGAVLGALVIGILDAVFPTRIL
ncbi:MAG: phage holin family protein [Oscillospiraceae bacterium]